MYFKKFSILSTYRFLFLSETKGKTDSIPVKLAVCTFHHANDLLSYSELAGSVIQNKLKYRS